MGSETLEKKTNQPKKAPEGRESVGLLEKLKTSVINSAKASVDFFRFSEEKELHEKTVIEQQKTINSSVLATMQLKQTIKSPKSVLQDDVELKYPGRLAEANKLITQTKDWPVLEYLLS